ncbi:hypothetical protein WH51_04810 [Bacilli bacterium VT-13-104]|nr:hypothetical protein WH51_04810 [Bacilli bacterium VT-13-104]
MLVLKSFSKFLSIILAFSLIFSTFGPAYADASTAEPLEDEEFEQLEELLFAIENIPDEVIDSGDDLIIMNWIKDNVENATLKSNFEIAINKYQNKEEITTYGAVGCAGALLAALGSNLFAPLKITKIKSAIKAAGGATKFVKKAKSLYDSYRKAGYKKTLAFNKAIDGAAGKASTEVKDAIKDFFGITGLLAACGLDT